MFAALLITAAVMPVGPAPAAAQEPAPAVQPQAEDDNAAKLEKARKTSLELMQAGRFADAVTAAEEALRLTEAIHGTDAVETGVAAHNLGFLLRRASRPEDAQRNLERALAIYERTLPAVHEDTRNAVGELAQIYLRASRGEDLIAIYQRLIARAGREGYGTHVGVAHMHNNVGFVQRLLGRREAAEQHLQEAVAIYAIRSSPEEEPYRLAIESLFEIYAARGNVDGARGIASETLAKLPPHGSKTALRLLDRLARLEQRAGRYTEARRHAAAALDRAGDAKDLDKVDALNNLAQAERALADYAAAEQHYKRAIEVLDTLGDAANSGILLDNLAVMLSEIGRLDEAERLNKRALQLIEQALGRDHPEVGNAAANFGMLLYQARRDAEAEPLLRRGLTIAEAQSPQDNARIAVITDNLSALLRRTGRLEEALRYCQRALGLFEATLPPDHPSRATTLNNLGSILNQLGRYAEAEGPLRRSLDSVQAQFGAGHVNTVTAATNLADTYAGLGDRGKARELLTGAIGALETHFGKSHANLLHAVVALAQLEMTEGHPDKAAPLFERAVGIEQDARQRSANGTQVLSDPSLARSAAFYGLLEALWQSGGEGDTAKAARALEIGEWTTMTDAANALAALGARAGAGDPALGGLTRTRQDLAAAWQAGDKKLTELLFKSGDRDTGLEGELRGKLGEIEARLAALDTDLAAKFPRFQDLARPVPLPVEELRGLLRPNEAAIQFAVGPDATHVWLVSKTATRWARIAMRDTELHAEVRALRCGLDAAEWAGAGRERCQELLKLPARAVPGSTDLLPFHPGRAHALFKTLFGPLGQDIKGKDLLIVASGPLTSLPFQVLVTDDPDAAMQDANGGLKRLAWLPRQHALTVLPSLASLKSLRQFARVSRATAPFIGFGNPLLTGESGADRRAWSHQACGDPATPVRGVEVAAVDSRAAQLARGGFGSVEALRRQPPLPETADEICNVAKFVGAKNDAVLLGANATEGVVKALSEAGSLADARILHFATHGLLAGETAMFLASKAEPALMLTPPDTASDADDGLLTASEVAALKLDADWVILSACNTASGDHAGGEALSGLTRAFFYAGARSLLVSHWAVDSEATVKLVTKAYEAIAKSPGTGPAEAMRRSMLALIEGGGHEAHPSYWAPFIVAGSGGTVLRDLATAAISPAIPPLPKRAPASLKRRLPPLPKAGMRNGSMSCSASNHCRLGRITSLTSRVGGTHWSGVS
jgi:CHAT domain-containing protein/tetratricopeptide (TPR) repeat protein